MCEICEAMARGEDIDADVRVVKLDLPNPHDMNVAEFVGRMAMAMHDADAPAEVIAEVIGRGQEMHARMLEAGRSGRMSLSMPRQPTKH